MEGIRLEFQIDALDAVAKRAIARKTGARGLRSILEAILLDPMFDLPGMTGIEQVVVGRDVVEGRAKPLYVHADRRGSVA
jgi:ATP-dependent Clp protease ATP-binding subunit ClpX